MSSPHLKLIDKIWNYFQCYLHIIACNYAQQLLIGMHSLGKGFNFVNAEWYDCLAVSTQICINRNRFDLLYASLWLWEMETNPREIEPCSLNSEVSRYRQIQLLLLNNWCPDTNYSLFYYIFWESNLFSFFLSEIGPSTLGIILVNLVCLGHPLL